MKELFKKIALKNNQHLKAIGLLLKIYAILPTPLTIKCIQTKSFDLFQIAQSAGAVEYTGCFSAEG